MEKLPRHYIFVSFLILLFSCFYHTSFADNQILTFKKGTHFLFVQSANSSTLSALADHPGTYQLVLHDVDRYVDYFSQRPDRIAGVMSLDDFIKAWYEKSKESFAKDAPNAILRAISNNKHIGFPIELDTPVYDKTKHTLTYIIRPLASNTQRSLPEVPANLGFTGLFIDGFCLNC